jgi:hypothetical protein
MKGTGAGVKGAGVKVKGAGAKIARPHLHRAGHGEQANNGARHAGEPQNGARHEGMSAPYVQPKPKSGDEGE